MAQQLNELNVQPLSRTSAFGSGLSPDDLFNQAEGDFVEGNLDLAIQGFRAYLDNYPGGERAAAAMSRIGDAYSHQNMLSQANMAFAQVINEYPDSSVIPSALYKRANALLSMEESDRATEDLKNLVVNFPDTSESEDAKGVLKKLGVRIPRPASNTRR